MIYESTCSSPSVRPSTSNLASTQEVKFITCKSYKLCSVRILHTFFRSYVPILKECLTPWPLTIALAGVTTSFAVSVFLFSILGMGMRPFELGKLARKLWKLGKVEMYKTYFKHKRIQFKNTVLCLKHSMALFFVFQHKNIKKVHVCS